MNAIYYEVVPVGVQWAMKVAGHDRTWCYPTQDQALSVAVNAARHLWELSGLGSGVRLQLADGNWQICQSFGPIAPDPEIAKCPTPGLPIVPDAASSSA